MTKQRVLIVVSVVSFIEWFNKENVDYLNKKRQCELHIACNFDYMEDTDESRTHAYIDKIKATSYYRNIYDENWTIPYLNSVIDKSIEIIKSFNPKESKELHLIELMK